MSTARHTLVTVRDLLFALKGVDPATPVIALDLATLDEMPLADLARFKELLHHWHALAERAHRERLAASRDEETE